MKQNTGTLDRAARLILALLIVILWFSHVVTGLTGSILLVIAFIFLATAILGVCPLYNLFGITTCNRKKSV